MVNSDQDGCNTHEKASGSSKKSKSKLHPQLSNVSFSALMGSTATNKPGNRSSNTDSFTFPNVSLRSLLLNTPFSQRSKPRRTCKPPRPNKNTTDGDSMRSSRNAPSSNSVNYGAHSLTHKESTSHNNPKSSTFLSEESEQIGHIAQNVLGSGSVVSADECGASLCKECPLCLQEYPHYDFPVISTCEHRACISCMQSYLNVEITESRTNIMCPQCTQLMHPTDIHKLLNNAVLSHKFEDFMLRRVLSVDPDARWCPAPDCGFAVIASECASCPKIKCEREGCGTYFCYHCKANWHPNQTCDMARAERSPNGHYSTYTYLSDLHFSDELKSCPRCQVLIVKQNDGSCNHMTCAVCNSEFCWLCMKEISDLHYLSPSGCTFWGKKPWSRKKKILWQLGTLVGAPLGIGLIAGLAVPAVIIGIPIWVGRKLHTRFQDPKFSCYSKNKRNLFIFGGVTMSALISPLLAGLSIGVGVPILLAYVYGVVPVSLCRSGGCGVTTSSSGVRIAFDNENDMVITIPGKNESNRDMQMYEFQSMNDLNENKDTDSNHKDSRSSYKKSKKVDVQAEIGPGKLSIINIDSTSLAPSEKSMANLDPENDSTRALAGSLLQYKLGETCLMEPTVVDDVKCKKSFTFADSTRSKSVVIDIEKPKGVNLVPDVCGLDDNKQPLLQKYKSSDHIALVRPFKTTKSKSQPELRN